MECCILDGILIIKEKKTTAQPAESGMETYLPPALQRYRTTNALMIMHSVEFH